VTIPFLRRKIEGVMTEGDEASPAFSSSLAWMLYACSQVYRLAVRVRVHLYDHGFFHRKSLPCKVVSIGNITAGGTGKTPMVCYVANLLSGLGLRVAVISRGYGGNAQRVGGVVSDGKTTLMGPEASGDEPQLLASRLKGSPLLVGKDRYRAGRQAISMFGVSALVLDDGFQHLALKRDLDLLLIDSTRPFGNGHCLPRGPLREPVSEIRRASAFVLTRWKGDTHWKRQRDVLAAHAPGRPIFKCMHVPDTLFVARQKEPIPLASLERQRLFAFSGIARNETFRETVSSLGGDIVDFLEFSDHHRYTHSDVAAIWKSAADKRVDNIITTEKDLVNMGTDTPSVPPLLVLGIRISFGDDAEAFADFLKTTIMARADAVSGPRGKRKEAVYIEL
jgi:tetraacyldisaccharide 4'-kinase